MWEADGSSTVTSRRDSPPLDASQMSDSSLKPTTLASSFFHFRDQSPGNPRGRSIG